MVNQLDLIAYHDAAYFDRDQAWRAYRDLAKLSAYAVDGLTYLSEHSRSAARSEGLLPDDKPNRAIYCGTEHTALVPVSAIQPPGTESAEAGFLLCLGVSYLHKNRLFALAMLAELHRQGWRGSLVLAGAQPPDGSSLPAEARFLLEHPELAPFVVNLGMISEAEKVWLYGNAGLVLYPTLSEGFGLMPFEAAHYGVPCLSTRQGSLVEVLPGGPAGDRILRPGCGCCCCQDLAGRSGGRAEGGRLRSWPRAPSSAGRGWPVRLSRCSTR